MTLYRLPALLNSVALFAVAAPGVAWTQDNAQTQTPDSAVVEYDAGVSLTGHYTDNVFQTANDRRDDFVTTLYPWASLSWSRGDFTLNLNASAEIARFATNSKEDYEDYILGAEARYQLNPETFLFGGLEYVWGHEDRSSPDDVNGITPTQFEDASGYFGVGGKIGDRRYRLGINLRQLDFDDVAAAGGGIIDGDDRDRFEGEAGGRFGIRTTETGEYFVQGIYDWREYDDRIDNAGLGFQRSSAGVQLGVGYTGEIGPLRGEVLIGYLSQNFDDPRFSTVNALDIGVDLTWPIDGKTRLTGIVERSLEETTLAGASSYLSTTAGVRLRHRVAPNASLAGYFFLTQNEYQGVGRTDFLTDTGVSLRYYLNPRLYVDADYDFRQRHSDVAGVDYDEHILSLRFGAGLDDWYDPDAGNLAAFSNSRFYAGVFAGDLALQTKVDGPRGGGGNLTADFGDRDLAGGVFAGFRTDVNDLVLGVELDAEFSDAEWTHTGNRNFSVSRGDAFGLSAIYGLRGAGDALLYSRFSLISTNFKSRYQKGSEPQVTVDSHELGLVAGIGAEVPLGHGLSGRLEYQLRAYEDYPIGAPLGVNDDNFANLESVMRVGLLYEFGKRHDRRKAQRTTDFTGFYAGGQLGHGTTQSDNSGPRPDATTTNFVLDATRSGQGFTAGMMAGYGRQINDFYIGGELELEASSADWNIERNPTGRIYSVEKQGTVGASVRVGYVLNDSVLIYGRVGYVQSRFNTNYQFNDVAVDQNDTLGGLRIGGGVEFALRENLNARLEYTHTEYDRHSVNFGTGVDQFDTTERLFRVGLTYQF